MINPKYFKGNNPLTLKKATRIMQQYWYIEEVYKNRGMDSPSRKKLTDVSYAVTLIMDWYDDRDNGLWSQDIPPYDRKLKSCPGKTLSALICAIESLRPLYYDEHGKVRQSKRMN